MQIVTSQKKLCF